MEYFVERSSFRDVKYKSSFVLGTSQLLIMKTCLTLLLNSFGSELCLETQLRKFCGSTLPIPTRWQGCVELTILEGVAVGVTLDGCVGDVFEVEDEEHHLVAFVLEAPDDDATQEARACKTKHDVTATLSLIAWGDGMRVHF